MNNLIFQNFKDIDAIPVDFGGDNFFKAKPIIPWDDVGGCSAAFIEIPVGKSSYPHHYHAIAEEIFYIISGSGKLYYYGGEKEIKSGDVLCFPAGEKGVHSIRNTSTTEPLIYIDFAANPKNDITVEPKTEKVKIFGDNIQDMTFDMQVSASN